MISRKVKVTWLTPEEGGLHTLPPMHRYAQLSRFDEDGPNWPDGSWTIVIDFETAPIDQGNPSVGMASFLVEIAPHERLQKGQPFGIYNGIRKVAQAEILE